MLNQLVLISTEVDGTSELAAKLFADPLRAQIVGLLAVEQLCTCHLVEMTGARQPTVSHHLKILRDADLVEVMPEGRFTYYRLKPEALEQLGSGIERLASSAFVASRRRACE